MVLGSGLVANGFREYDNNEQYLIFASGVSNSNTNDKTEFLRESRLLGRAIQEHPDKTFVYFSTCSLYDPSMENSPYVKHKLAMEELLQKDHRDFRLFRVSNIAGKTKNPHTFLNYFANHIRKGGSFLLWKNAWRNIIDLEDARAICGHILQNRLFRNQVVNVASPQNYPVVTIVELLEEILSKKGRYRLVDKGNSLAIDTGMLRQVAAFLGISFGDHYLPDTLKKYYSQP
jgi:nucleoside-diphosphate-sugar epimerase